MFTKLQTFMPKMIGILQGNYLHIFMYSYPRIYPIWPDEIMYVDYSTVSKGILYY